MSVAQTFVQKLKVSLSDFTLFILCLDFLFFFPMQPTASVIQEFMTMMAICHTAVPERIDNKITYQAASPGESNCSPHTGVTNVHIRFTLIESPYQYTTVQQSLLLLIKLLLLFSQDALS